MATSWMAAKTAKIKRDGIAASRGICPTFSKTERDHLDPARINRSAGLYVVAMDKTPRGLPRSYGPFPDHASAETFGRGMVTPPGRGKRPMADDYRVEERGVAKPKPAPLPENLTILLDDYRGKQAAALELKKALREAQGKRTKFTWSR